MKRTVRERVLRVRGILGPIVKPGKYWREIQDRLERQLALPPTKKQVAWCYRDFLWFRILFNGSMHDYFDGQMYRKSNFVREESLSRYVRFPWRDAIQRQEDWVVFQDKREFYKAFSEHLHRDWMILGPSVSWEEYLAFLARCSYQVFVKIPESGGGKGVRYMTPDTLERQRELFRAGQKEEYILEGKLRQCEEIYSFANASVNTFRMITLVDAKGQVHLAAAVLRMGSGQNPLDNFCMGGMSAVIDVDTGIICSTAKDGNGKEYLCHPNTGKQIIGYRIPDWQGYKDFAVSLGKKYPQMRYVGWDIIKDIYGNYCVIEGNKDAGVELIECHFLWGLKPYYEAILNVGEYPPGGDG